VQGMVSSGSRSALGTGVVVLEKARGLRGSKVSAGPGTAARETTNETARQGVSVTAGQGGTGVVVFVKARGSKVSAKRPRYCGKEIQPTRQQGEGNSVTAGQGISVTAGQGGRE
jgi:hypothetical protein